MNGKKIKGSLLVLMVAVISLFFGLSFVFSSIAMKELKPIELLSVRWLFPAVLYGISIALGLIKVSYKGKPVLPLILIVLCQPVLYALFEAQGIKLTTASEGSIFVAAIPLAVVALETAVLKKKPSRRAVAGVIVGFAGVLCCIVFAPAAAVSGKLAGYIFLLLTMLAGAGYVVAGSNLSGRYSTFEISIAMAIGGALTFNLINFLSGNGLHAYQVLFSGGKTTAALLFLGVGCSFLTYFLYNAALAAMPATVAGCVITNSINVVGVVAGILITNDPWGLYTVTGVLLTIIGIVLSATAGEAKQKT